MANIAVTGVDLLQVYHQLSVRLGDASSVEGGASAGAHALERALLPQFLQIVWDGGQMRRVFGPQAAEAVCQPSAGQLALLDRGELVMEPRAEQLSWCYAPLRVRRETQGWVCLGGGEWQPEHVTFLASVAAQLAASLAMLEVSESREDQLVYLRTLNEVGQLLGGVLDLDALLDAIYVVTARLVDAPFFYIALYHRSSDMFELIHLVSEGQVLTTGDYWPASVGLSGVVVRERQPLCTADYQEECRRRGVSPRPFSMMNSSRAWLGVPLIARDQVIGVMSSSSPREGYAYTPEHVELFTTVASQAAAAIENARLYQRSERQARQLAVLNQIGRTITSSLDPVRVPSLIMEQVSELLDVEEGSLLLTDDESGDLVFAYTIGPVGSQLIGQRLARGVGLAGYVAETGLSVFSNDVRQDERFDDSTDRSTGYTTRALLATPLRGVGGVRGVIEVLNRRNGALFTEDDQKLLEAVADYAVIALENARRFGEVDQALARRAEELARTNGQLQHNLRSLTALNALGMAINTALRTAEEIFGMTARGVAEMTGALGAGVFVPEGDIFRAVVQVGAPVAMSPQLSPLLGRVLVTGRPELMLGELPASIASVGARAVLVVPLRATQHTLGCMCVYYADNVPDGPDRETVVLFATQAAGAVESIELFTAVRAARDQMASILASTREGIVLIGPDARVAIANAALHELCGLAPQATRGVAVESFLSAWDDVALYLPEDWVALRRALDNILAGRESFVSGVLREGAGPVRFVEWTLLTAISSGDVAGQRGGALLVLRDITEARESEQLREDLTHMIVHDLRSPLSSVMASIDLLLRGVSGQLNESQQHVLSIASGSSQQMLEMISTLLDISRLEAGRMPLDLAPCDVAALVAQATSQMASLAQERRITVQLDLERELPLAQADVGLVVRVVQNLLANALKFSGRGSTVLVRTYATDGAGIEVRGARSGITVSVSDQGVGIATKDRDKIFAKFGQVGERRGGTGLGLTFCKLVVEAHAGHIWVESEPGRGSTFFFMLPLEP
ncbi:MAG: hypothetical protein RLZZ387_1356 [Chloroflexota bacterium]